MELFIFNRKLETIKLYNMSIIRQPIGTLLIELLNTDKDIQHRYLDAIRYCLDVNGTEEYNELSPIQRFNIYKEVIGMQKADVSISFDVRQGDTEFELVERVSSNNINDICLFEFKEMLINNSVVKKCKHCNKYFIVKNRIDTDYCDRLIEITTDGLKKTCKDIGPKIIYREKINKDPIRMAYNKAYKTQYSRIKGRMITKELFLEWSGKAKNMMTRYQKEEITENVFMEWLINSLKEMKSKTRRLVCI